jgi:prophage DNA circulation protein
MLKKAAAAAKNIGTGLLNKVKSAITAVLKKVKAILSKIAALGKKMFGSLMKFLGLQISFTSNIPGEISL